jgi:hypothetical protein
MRQPSYFTGSNHYSGDAKDLAMLQAIVNETHNKQQERTEIRPHPIVHNRS